MKHDKNRLKTWLKKCNIKPQTWRMLQPNVPPGGSSAREVYRGERRSTKKQQQQLRRHTTMLVPANTDCICPAYNTVCGSRIGLYSHQRIHC
jgi:hypothetical protein